VTLAWLQGRRRLKPLYPSKPLRKTGSVSQNITASALSSCWNATVPSTKRSSFQNDRSHRTCSPPKRFVNLPWSVHTTPAIPDIQTSLGRDGKCLSHPELLEPRPGGKCRTGKAQNRAAFTPILFHPKEAFCEGKKRARRLRHLPSCRHPASF
jgi:hypothetical protein